MVTNSLNEHLDKILFKCKYVINEAKYQIADGIDNDDQLPNEIWSNEPELSEADEEKSTNEDMPEASIDPDASNIDISTKENPEVATNQEDIDKSLNTISPTINEPTLETNKSTDEIQNEIIKLNLSAMQKMNNEIDRLNQSLNSLNGKMVDLDKNVEEVREPTNIEKLTARKNDSHPFYYNLNDMWEGNWFQARRQAEDLETNGMKKLDDGSYIADLNKLPQFTDREIKDSFDQ